VGEVYDDGVHVWLRPSGRAVLHPDLLAQSVTEAKTRVRCQDTGCVATANFATVLDIRHFSRDQ
jgi:hypothetical protein